MLKIQIVDHYVVLRAKMYFEFLFSPLQQSIYLY